MNETARCKEVLAFMPEFEQSFVPKPQVRLLTRTFDGVGAFGLSPSVYAKFRPGKGDKLTFEVPFYYSQSGSTLSSGLKFVYEIDYEKSDNQAASALFLFLSTEFSLDGSKE